MSKTISNITWKVWIYKNKMIIKLHGTFWDLNKNILLEDNIFNKLAASYWIRKHPMRIDDTSLPAIVTLAPLKLQ